MSVSGAQFGNLDNFKRTALSGGDAVRRMGTRGGDIAREARRLRRQGDVRGAQELQRVASAERLGDRDRFGSSLVSREQRMDAEQADIAAAEEDNQRKIKMIEAFTSLANPATRTTTPETKTPEGVAGATSTLPTTTLGIRADQVMRERGGSDTTFRQGLDRAIGMAKTDAERSELLKTAKDSGISEDAFRKRIDFWNKKNTPAFGRRNI